MRKIFKDTVAALAETFISARYGEAAAADTALVGDAADFVLAQHARMPDYLRLPFFGATLFFSLSALATSGGLFHRLSDEKRQKHIRLAKKAGPFCDLMRFYEGLSIFAYGEALERGAQSPAPAAPAAHNAFAGEQCDVVVIGSGPGGAITAALLAEAGREVMLLEAGPHLAIEDTPEFSRAEMEQKYRNGGITAAFGKTKISYVEGRCAGGGSEINAGLYHRTPEAMLARWQQDYALDAASLAEFTPFFEANERDLSVSPLQGEHPAASIKMRDGATRMGWSSMEVPRWFKFDGPADTVGKKQSMTRTFIPRAIRAGARLISETRVAKIEKSGTQWRVHCENAERNFAIRCNTLFVCAGAIHTAALLRRSGITQNIGNSLRMHPTVKVVARFPDVVNSRDMGVTVEQIKEFSPRLSFGVSVSRAPYISLSMLDHPDRQQILDQRWPNMAIYYAMITGGNGSVRNVPGYRDPLVRYTLSEADMRNLAEGAKKLSQLLLAAGAEELYPTVAGIPPIRSETDLQQLPDILPSGRASLMSVHLFSSCPMGENRERCATDSFGKVHGHDNLYINDGSLLCTAPGANPQGSIMAFARRNAAHFLQRNR
jgi:choline dehydrogenase-like flavoprotein